MTPQSQQSPQAARATQEDVRRDLQASLEARRELGPDYDDHFLDALVEKLNRQVQQTQQRQVVKSKSSEQFTGAGDLLADFRHPDCGYRRWRGRACRHHRGLRDDCRRQSRLQLQPVMKKRGRSA